jgi:hypothetical protein
MDEASMSLWDPFRGKGKPVSQFFETISEITEVPNAKA